MRSYVSIFLMPMLLIPSIAYADDLTISARTWLIFDGLASGDQPSANDNEVLASFSSPPFKVPMVGGSIAYRADTFLPSTTFTLTGLFGSDDEILTTRGSATSTVSRVVGGVTQTGQQIIFSLQRTPERLRRRDFELTAQTRVNDLISWTIGARYERARVRFSPVVTSTANDPFVAGKVDSVTVNYDSFTGGYDLISARAGIAVVAPLNEQRSDFIYANGMGFVGHRFNLDRAPVPQYDDATFVGPDLTIGYSHRFGDNVSLDLRYRAQFFFSVGGAGRIGEPKSTHGPSAGLSYSF